MIKVKDLKNSFKGINLGSTVYAGVNFEKELSKLGTPVQSGPGPDYPKQKLEVKTKSQESRSANVVGTMSRTDIINTPYEKSSIRDKMQQQLRVETEEGIIVEENIFDFSPAFIQDVIKEAYEIGRDKLSQPNPPNYIHCTKYGYFEKRRHTEDSYMYRINVGAMKELEAMAKSTFNNFFDYK